MSDANIRLPEYTAEVSLQLLDQELSVHYAPIAVTLLVGAIIGEAELRERGKEDNASVDEYVPHDVRRIQEAFRWRM